MPEIIGIHHVNFSVTDLQRSAGWYMQVLGLTMGWEMADTEGRGQKIALLHPTSPFRLVLSHHTRNDGQPASEFRSGLDHLAFTVTDRAELERWHERFEQLGVDHSEIKEGATGYLITFRDPDNIQLEVYSLSKE